MTKRDLGFDHECICEKLEIIPGFHLASQKSIPNINQVFSLVLKLSWCCYWLYQMVWKYFWWYFIMFANSRNIMKHHSCPLCVWHVGRLRRIATSVSSRQAAGWYPKCVAWSWAMTQQFGARCFLVFCSCAFLQVSSEGLCEWWCPALSSWRAPIHFHHLPMMMVSMLSWLQWASSCWLEMVSGQKICRILLRFFVWKTDSSVMSLS